MRRDSPDARIEDEVVLGKVGNQTQITAFSSCDSGGSGIYTIFFRIVRTRYPIMFSSVAQSCPTLCNPMDRSTPGIPVHHQLPELAQTHVCRVGDTIQPSHPLSSPSPPTLYLSQHQGLFKGVSSLYQVAKVLGVSASPSVLSMKIQN